MKKLLLALSFILFTTNISFADITVEQARSREQLKKEGYSSVLIDAVQREAGEYNPKPTNRWQNAGFKIWNYFDPASPEKRDAKRHDIKFYPHYEDL